MSGKQITLFKDFKPEEIQSYISQINAVKTASNGIFNDEAALNYAIAIEGLESKQAALLLSTQGLSNAQIQETLAIQGLTEAQRYEAMTQSGLLKSKQQLTNVEVQSNIAKTLSKTMSEEEANAKAQELMASMKLSVAKGGENAQTVKLTSAKLSELVTEGKLTQAQAQEIAARTGVLFVTEAQNTLAPKWIVNMKAMALATWDQVKATAVWLATTPAGWAIAAVGALLGVIGGMKIYQHHVEKIRQATEESANAYKESTSSIEDYVSRYQELHKALLEAKGNEEETYNIKKQLLDLQIELNDKFGEEYGKVNLVTDAYRDQTNAISELNKEAAKKYLNENQEGIENDFDEMDKTRHYSLSDRFDIYSDTGREVKKIVEQYQDLGISLVDELGDGNYSQVSIQLNANATDAYDTIHAFENDIRDLAKRLGDEELLSEILRVSSSSLNDAKDVISKHGTQTREALLAEIRIDDDLNTVYDKVITAVDELNEAILNSEDPFNDEKVNTARQNLADIQASIQNNEEEWGRYSLVMDEVFDKADTKAIDFANTLRSEASIQPLIDSIRGMNELDLNILANTPDITSPAGQMAFDALNPEKQVFDDLISKAKEYGFVVDDSAEEVQKLIDLLVNLGIVQKDLAGEDTTPELFSSFDGSEVGERLQYIKEQLDAGEISCKEYFDALNNEIANVDFSNYTNSIEEANAASQQFFTDSIQQTASGLSDLISKFDSGSISVSEYLDGYLSIANTLSILTDELQKNSSSWDQNGNAMANATSEMLDNTQVSLDNAISTIESYQDSIYSLEQIMSGAVEAGTDEFTAHTQVIAEDLANIVASGGEMADEIANTLGTTTSEIASNMSENVSNQSLAAQAITANTNAAIADMADSVGQLFDTLGNAISNFNVDLTFGISDFNLKDVALGILGVQELPEVKFSLQASGESLSTIGAAISNFGKSISSNLKKQTIELPDYNFKGDNKYTPNAGILDNYNKKSDNLKNSHTGAGKAAKDAADEAVNAINKQIKALEREKEAAQESFQTQIDGIDDLVKEKEKQIDAINDEIDAINDEADAIKKASEARKRDIDLQKAQYDVERAENQKTSFIYTEDKGMIYVPDTEGIRDKREKVTEIQEEIEIANLQKKIDLKKNEIDGIEDEIDALEEQKDLIKEMMEESNKYYESLIKDLQDAAEEAKKTAQETENAAGNAVSGVGNAIKGLRNAVKDEKSFSYYIWTDEDENALISAQGRLAELNRLIETGVDVERYTKLRDEVANFVDEYSRLKETRQITDEFKDSLDVLLGSNDAYVNNFLGLVDGIEERIETTSNYSEQILEYVDKTNNGLDCLHQNLDNAKTSADDLKHNVNDEVDSTSEKVNSITDNLTTLAHNFSDVVLKKTELDENVSQLISDAKEATKNSSDELQTVGDVIGNIGKLIVEPTESLQMVGQIIADSVQNMDDFSSSASVVANDVENLKSSMSGLDTADETIDGVIDGEVDKLTTLDESINAVSDSVLAIQDSQENINNLAEAFTSLGEAIKNVSDALGIGEEGTVAGLVEALNSISETSLSGEDGGIISEFQDLKTAIEEVSAAVSGGGSEGVTGTSGTRMSESGASSLTDAINELKKVTDKALGSGDEEGDSGSSGEGEGVIGKFTVLKQAVDAVTHAIGLDSEGDIDPEDSENLIGAIHAQYNAAIKVLPEEKLLFEDLQGSIKDCVSALNEMIDALNEIQSIDVPGVVVPSHEEGTVGNAFAHGYHGLPHAEKNALRSEYGQPELTVYPSGKAELTTEPVMSDLPKGTVIYNEEQTNRILNGKTKPIEVAHAKGILKPGEIAIDGQVFSPYDPEKDISPMGEINRKLAAFAESIDKNKLGLMMSPMTEMQRDMERMTNNVRNITNMNNRQQITVENHFDITCPGVTSQEVMRNLGPALDEKFRGFHNYADQMSRIG